LKFIFSLNLFSDEKNGGIQDASYKKWQRREWANQQKKKLLFQVISKLPNLAQRERLRQKFKK
jgi:hypothetical protein